MPALRNVELKAVDPNPAKSLDICHELGAVDHGVLLQRDTYFDTRIGGLKLREERPGRPHLIQWQRQPDANERVSTYRIVAVDDAATARSALSDALGIRVIVSKRRHLFIWNDVRIHLDSVTDLGTFIELEAVASNESDLSLERRLVTELREAFAITADRLRGGGYAEALSECAQPSARIPDP